MVLIGMVAIFFPSAVPAEETTATNVSPIRVELETLVQSVQTKIADGKVTEADLADDLKHFDLLLAKENGAKTDEVAQIALFKALLYFQVFENTEKGTALLKQIKADYPGTTVSQQVDRLLQSLAEEQGAKKLQAGLVVGAIFPDFSEKDLSGQPLSVSQFKGKVVLLDFWATWCGPCRAELPNVIETYQKHHTHGFEIIGISLDSDRDQLAAFLKQQAGMTWPQYIDKEGEANKLATKYGVEAIPFTLLIGRDGKIIGKDLSGEALGKAVAGALGKN
jgi:thiol-disulfide isomerase/thioredoxin